MWAWAFSGALACMHCRAWRSNVFAVAASPEFSYQSASAFKALRFLESWIVADRACGLGCSGRVASLHLAFHEHCESPRTQRLGLLESERNRFLDKS